MILNIITPHISNCGFAIIASIKRCRDRGCRCSRRHTRKLLQEDYEEINTGAEFLIEFRYSQVLSTLYIVFMYSTGLPILYVVAVATFFLTYWTDKLLCKILITLFIYD
jgi:hypothetical protein